MSEAGALDFMSDDILDSIFAEESETVIQSRINELRQQAKARRVTKEFDAAIKARRDAIKAMKDAERAKAAQERRKQLNMTHFEGLEAHGYKNVLCGAWDAYEDGITMPDNKQFEVRACRHPILPVQILKNVQTGREKAVIAFKKMGRWQFQTVRKEVLASANKIVDLAAVGISVNSECAKALVRYLSDVEAMNADSISVRESSSKFGFVRGRFIPYDSDDIEFDADGDLPQLSAALEPAGDRDKWFDHIKSLRAGKNFPVQMIMGASFGSVLLCKIGALPFLLDVWGDTEAGKTVAEYVACSIWADPKESAYIGDFKATEVALEVKASALNHLPLILDDTSKTSKRIRDNFEGFVYDMCSGKGKSRSDKTLGVRAENAWQLAIITTGESPINGYVNQGGAMNRVLELHALRAIFPDPHETAELMKENYGWAGREFVSIVQGFTDAELRAKYNEILEALQGQAGAAMQKQLMSLAVVLLADRLAADHLFCDGIYIDPQEALEVLTDPTEVSSNERCYKYISDEILMNRSRFDRDTPAEQWGVFDSESVVCLFPTVLERLCTQGGFSVRAFTDFAVKKGIIDCAKDGKRQRLKKVDGKAVRMYFFHLPAEEQPAPDKAEFTAAGPTPFD